MTPPTTPDPAASLTTNPSYQLVTGEDGYRSAIDTVLTNARHEICVFDRDLIRMRLNDTMRLTALADFVRGERKGRIRIVLHDSGPLLRDMPRLTDLARQFGDRIQIRLSPATLRHLADCHVIADAHHGVRRFHYDQPRAALELAHPSAIHPWQQRFDELWSLTKEEVSISVSGL